MTATSPAVPEPGGHPVAAPSAAGHPVAGPYAAGHPVTGPYAAGPGPGAGYPGALPVLPPPEPYLLTIGDIGVTPSWVVTPRGTVPLLGSQWWVAERSGWRQQIPVWAIVLAVLLFPLGLLFLLVKEPRLQTWLEVTVRSAGVVHQAAVAVPSVEAAQVPGKVAHVRDLARPRGAGTEGQPTGQVRSSG